MPLPELLKERGLEAGRLDPAAFKNTLNGALKARLGAQDWIEAFEPPNLYLNLNAVEKEKYRQPDVEALAAKIAYSVPGIGDVYTAVQFVLNQLPIGPLAPSVQKSYYAGRSGDLIIVPRPGYAFIQEPTGTTSGSPYTYDSQVPLILLGHSIQSGRYGQSTSPADIAPTIASLLGIEVPSLSEGRVLSECLSTSWQPRAAASIPSAPQQQPETVEPPDRRRRF